jgi:hypothetical protein
MKNYLLIGALALVAVCGGIYVWHTGDATPIYVGLGLVAALFVLSFLYLAAFRSRAMIGMKGEESSEDGRETPVRKDSPVTVKGLSGSGGRIPLGTLIVSAVIIVLLCWLIFGGGWDTLTGWVPASRTVQHTKVVYQTKVEHPTFVPMTQAQVCSSIPVRTLDLYTTTWTDLIAIPPGCIAMTDLTPGEGFVNQCKGMNGEYPIACGGNGTEIQFQKLGGDDGKPLKLRFWFAPLTTK